MKEQRILFKKPTTYRESVMNTIMFIIQHIKNVEECIAWENRDSEVFNKEIETLKQELDCLKM